GTSPARQKETRHEHDGAGTAGGRCPGRRGPRRGGRGADGQDRDRAGGGAGRATHLPRHPERAMGGARRGRAADDGRGGRQGQRGTVAGTGVAARAGRGRVPGLRSRHRDVHLARRGRRCHLRRPRRSARRRGGHHVLLDGRGVPGLQRGLQQRAGLRVASAHRRPLARHGRLHQGRPAWRPDRGRDRRDGRHGGGPDRGRLGRGRRLRVRHADHGYRRAVPGGAGPRHRLPRRLDRPLPGRGRPARRRQRAVRGRGGLRPARPGLRPDHLLRLPARHRRSPRRAEEGPAGAGAGRSGAPGRAAGGGRRPGQPEPERAHVLRHLDPGLHAERGVPEDRHVLRAAGGPGRRETAADPRGRGRVWPRPQARRSGSDEPGVGTATLTSHDGAMSRADRLIGRESALAAASSVLDDARGGTGQFLMISGEAGIGKTAMLAALARRAGQDPLVLRGFCWEGDGAPPYWPWSQVLQASGLPMADLGEAGWLLQPASGPAEPMSAAAAGDAQFRLFEAVARWLRGLAAGRPVLVVLDDLHWADEPSLRLLGFLARALAAEPVGLLGAYRDTEASPELYKIAGQAQQLALAGLTPDDVGALARELSGTTVPPQVTAQLWERSGGNPFFVRELIRLLLAQGSWHQPAQIPASVAETLRRRLARLSTECVRLLEWAAIAGRDIDVGLLTHGAAAGHEPAALSLLDEARQAGVITGALPPRFTHDLYRETIIEGLSTTTRTAINLSVGRALQARSGPAARVAAHLLAAGPQARPDALDYSLLAAREATARLGHEDACAYYLRALHVISERGCVTAERVEILLELAASHERTGRSDLAAQRYREAADVSRMAADAMGLARAALGIQTLGYRSGAQNAELLELLREASRRLEAAGGPVALQSRVLAALARTLRHGTDQRPGAEIIGAADEAVRLAAAAEDASALGTAKLAVHDAMWVPGSAARRLPVIAEILDAARASGDDDLAAEAHLLRAAALLELGDPAGRDELLTYVTLAGQLGHARGRWGALTRQATFAQLAGRPDEAARLGEQALELGLAIGEPDAVGCFYTLRAALTVFGVSGPPMELDAADPLWPMLPVFKAWPFAARGEAAAAAAVLGDFSVLDITMWTGLEALAAAAVVFAAAGSDAQRTGC